MDNEAYAFALKNTLDEMQKACPDIRSAFVINEDRELIAQDESTPEKTVARTLEIFEEIADKADAINGIQDITIEGLNGRVNISHIDEIYLVTVTNKKADLNYVNTVTNVLVPTVLRLIEKLTPAPIEREQPSLEMQPEAISDEEAEAEADQEVNVEKNEELQGNHEETEKILPEPRVNQFIVEDLKGMLVPSDTVRMDNSILVQWDELYEERIIEEADVETFGGKVIRCKVKPIKDSKLEGQGKIQIPNKIQHVLDVKKGELVRVKPVVN